MRDRRLGWTLLILTATTLGTLGVAAAPLRPDDPPAQEKAKANDARAKKGGLRVPFAAPPKNQQANAPDPLAQARQAPAAGEPPRPGATRTQTQRPPPPSRPARPSGRSTTQCRSSPPTPPL